jgi:hypothetical protein
VYLNFLPAHNRAGYTVIRKNLDGPFSGFYGKTIRRDMDARTTKRTTRSDSSARDNQTLKRKPTAMLTDASTRRGRPIYRRRMQRTLVVKARAERGKTIHEIFTQVAAIYARLPLCLATSARSNVRMPWNGTIVCTSSFNHSMLSTRACRLKQLDWITVGIFQLDLLAARPLFHLVAKM